MRPSVRLLIFLAGKKKKKMSRADTASVLWERQGSWRTLNKKIEGCWSWMAFELACSWQLLQYFYGGSVKVEASIKLN